MGPWSHPKAKAAPAANASTLSIREMRRERMFKLHSTLVAFFPYFFRVGVSSENRTKPLFCPLLPQGGEL
jgi:hypothetical protein